MIDGQHGLGGGSSPPRRLRFSVVPVSTTIEVERPNAFKATDDDPETMVVELKAWPSGPGCPIWVEIQVEAAHDTYRLALKEEMERRERDGQIVTDEQGTKTYTGPTHQLSQIIATYRRDLLCAAIEGLAEHEAALLVAHGGPWEEILVALGRWTRAQPGQAPPVEKRDPEAQAGEATAPSSPA